MNVNLTLKDILALGSLEAAPRLLGAIISRLLPQGTVSLRIVETEAYHQNDEASHSFRGMTVRTAPMFETAGTIYVYFTYGMHYCLNVVTGEKGNGEAVLLRAAEPLQGIEIMLKNRGVDDSHQIANGPAKLTQALGIKSTELSGKELGTDTLQLSLADKTVPPDRISSSPRIGISQAIDHDWRFFIKDDPFLSRR